MGSNLTSLGFDIRTFSHAAMIGGESQYTLYMAQQMFLACTADIYVQACRRSLKVGGTSGRSIRTG